MGSYLPPSSTFCSQFLIAVVKLLLPSELNVSHLNFLDAFLSYQKDENFIFLFILPLAS